MVQPPAVEVKMVRFCEQQVQVFGHTGIRRGRLKLEVDDRRIDQRFLGFGANEMEPGAPSR
jgi:hypothetical protein